MRTTLIAACAAFAFALLGGEAFARNTSTNTSTHAWSSNATASGHRNRIEDHRRDERIDEQRSRGRVLYFYELRETLRTENGAWSRRYRERVDRREPWLDEEED